MFSLRCCLICPRERVLFGIGAGKYMLRVWWSDTPNFVGNPMEYYCSLFSSLSVTASTASGHSRVKDYRADGGLQVRSYPQAPK